MRKDEDSEDVDDKDHNDLDGHESGSGEDMNIQVLGNLTNEWNHRRRRRREDVPETCLT